MKTSVEIRPTTAEDMRVFYGKPVKPTVKAWSVFWKDELTCIAGLTLSQQGFVAFSDVKPNDAPKMTVWRTIKKLMDLIGQTSVLYSSPHLDKPSAPKMLKTLGFQDTGKEIDGKPVYVRRVN